MSAEETSIQYIKGVGPARALLLKGLGIESVGDALYYFPRAWQDRRINAPILSRHDVSDIIFGTVKTARFFPTRSGLGIFKAVISARSGKEISAVWFKKISRRYGFDPFATLKKYVVEGAQVWVVGKTDEKGNFAVEEFYPAADSHSALMHVERIVPIYPLTSGVSAKFMRETIFYAVEKYAPSQKEILPPPLISKRKLLAVSQALKGIHFPDSASELEHSRKRLAYEEFLLLTTAWQIKRRQTKSSPKGYSYEIKKNLLSAFRQKLGFEFTAAQKKAINEIFADMQSKYQMARLLQGDVGSGKTVVALSALLLAVENGFQGVFMAPTEILAEQHFMTFEKFLGGLPLRFEILTSKTKPSARQKIIQDVASGAINILIGTHAVLEEDVRFNNLRLAVIDEQHRFGVRQRASLKQKSAVLDMLMMTATPIPRTLALVIYGDLDVSTIDSMPPGRQAVKTLILDENSAFAKAREEISRAKLIFWWQRPS
ncbi:MAG: DEAD/DEAH box helicase [Elusimicrobia bacterium]|nr:DEAD/DEAH box helicase [Elusimicrobiota bacterium]